MGPVITHPLMLYDGDCGMCSRGVRFILDRDAAGVFRFAPLQSRLGCELRARHGIAGLDSKVLIDGERAWLRSDAVLRMARRLPVPWRLAGALLLVPRPLRDALYRLVARTRRRWGPPDGCRLLTPRERERFLDA